jgi:hypothetical protein
VKSTLKHFYTVQKLQLACSLLMHDRKYPGVAPHDDAAGNNERSGKQRRFGGVTIVVLQDGASPQFIIQAEHTWKGQQLDREILVHLS